MKARQPPRATAPSHERPRPAPGAAINDPASCLAFPTKLSECHQAASVAQARRADVAAQSETATRSQHRTHQPDQPAATLLLVGPARLLRCPSIMHPPAIAVEQTVSRYWQGSSFRRRGPAPVSVTHTVPVVAEIVNRLIFDHCRRGLPCARHLARDATIGSLLARALVREGPKPSVWHHLDKKPAFASCRCTMTVRVHVRREPDTLLVMFERDGEQAATRHASGGAQACLWRCVSATA
jgi:hypothetical protein